MCIYSISTTVEFIYTYILTHYWCTCNIFTLVNSVRDEQRAGESNDDETNRRAGAQIVIWGPWAELPKAPITSVYGNCLFGLTIPTADK